ncbi:MAG: GMC family oxidoreductase [Egibacteraceae bacterium]
MAIPPASPPPDAAASYDYIVVGGGTAGIPLAVRLAADPDVNVALIEAGPSDAGDDRVLQLQRWMDLLGTHLDYDYTIEPQPRGNGAIRHSRARVLGGCSSHNSCIAFRAPDRDLDEWVALGAAGWTPADCRPHYDRVFETVTIAEQPVDNPLFEAVLAAGEEAGLPRVKFNGDDFGDGVGQLQINVRDGVRQSTSVAYLHERGVSPNLDVLVDTTVFRVELDERLHATGVATNHGPVRAEREVILCAGVFDTPRLLLLSGVGPAGHLADVGIDVRVDLPGVGEHLLDHPEGVVIWESTRPVPQDSSQLWELGIFATTQPGADAPDLMYHFGLMAFDLNTLPQGYPTAGHAFSLTPNVCRARSEGTVRLRSSNPGEVPRIDFRYFTDADGYDEAVMLAGVKLAREIVGQPSLRPWVRRELAPGPDVTDDAALSAYGRRTANTVYHPAGTCRMGAPDDPRSVVGPDLAVLGITGLRVADASVFPSMTTTNPAITCMMIGEKCAEHAKVAGR